MNHNLFFKKSSFSCLTRWKRSFSPPEVVFVFVSGCILGSLITNRVLSSQENCNDGIERALSVDTQDHQLPYPSRPGKTCEAKPLTNMQDLYAYIETIQMPCSNPVTVGGQKRTHPPYLEGDKKVCMESRFNFVPGRCIVFSFGIDRDFSFDDEMDNKYSCKVYSFDPTIHLKDHNRSANVKFFNLGISDVDEPDNKAMKVSRYVNILKMLGHENSIIDYLKIDIEGNEVHFFRDVFSTNSHLLDNVKQIGMEVHPRRGEFTTIQKELWRSFQFLECYGFKVMFTSRNNVKENQFQVAGDQRACCYELVWARDRKWVLDN